MRVLSIILLNLLLSAGPKDVKDIFSELKDTAAELSGTAATLKQQVLFLFTLLFSN